MTSVELWSAVAAVIAALAAVCGPALTAVYMRGKLDAHARSSADRLEEFGKKIEGFERARLKDGEDRGAQGVLNANASAAAAEARAAHQLSIKVEERQTAHEKGCDRRQEAIWSRFDRTDEKIEHMSAEIRNLALGLANSAVEIPATAPRRPNRRA